MTAKLRNIATLFICVGMVGLGLLSGCIIADAARK